MLRQAKEFKSFKLRASDGEIGKASEFYFDDKHWTVRYLVADTGNWLSDRRVLISPNALNHVNEDESVILVDLTKKQIEESPKLDSDQPVSRQYEMQYHDYHGWSYNESPEAMKECIQHEETWNPKLRSTSAITGYHIEALDGGIGHIVDFIIDEETWSIRYLVVDTKNWWAGKHVIVSPQWIERINWEESKVFVNLSREAIKQSPEYTPDSLHRVYEIELHRHYDRKGYWSDEPTDKGR